MSALVLLLGIALAQSGFQAPRDAPPPPRTGTGVIRGMIVAADTGLPMRRAVVTLILEGGAGPGRTSMAGLAGDYEFSGLAAGTYYVRVEPGSFRLMYQGGWYGATRGGTSRASIALAEGQQFEHANVSLPRGGAMEGRVVDDFGDPLARVNVYAARVLGSGGSLSRIGIGSQTDDLGRFRLYGLPAGDYVVAAEARATGMSMAAEAETEGFATTYFPSTPVAGEATRVRSSPGGEVQDLQIQLVRSRIYRLSGVVLDSQGRSVSQPGTMLSLVRSTPGGSESGGSGVSFDQTGRFTIRNVLPGDYRLVARLGSPRGPQRQDLKSPRQEYASFPVHVSGDIDDLVVVTSPGVSVAGTIVFADGGPQNPPGEMRVIAQPADRVGVMGPPPAATADPDMRFTLDDLFGPVRVRLQRVPPGHALQSVRVGWQEITDEAFEFKASHNGQLQIVLTSRVARLEGQVAGDDGAPVDEAIVLVVPEEREFRKVGSSRLHVAPSREGRYSLPALLPGRYHVVAVSREDFALSPDTGPEFFDPLVKDSSEVVLDEGETRTVDLRVFKRPDR